MPDTMPPAWRLLKLVEIFLWLVNEDFSRYRGDNGPAIRHLFFIFPKAALVEKSPVFVTDIAGADRLAAPAAGSITDLASV
ncbi:MAG: hypothetical protein AAB915_00410 [Patescibacteria group bacterium]